MSTAFNLNFIQQKSLLLTKKIMNLQENNNKLFCKRIQPEFEVVEAEDIFLIIQNIFKKYFGEEEISYIFDNGTSFFINVEECLLSIIFYKGSNGVWNSTIEIYGNFETVKKIVYELELYTPKGLDILWYYMSSKNEIEFHEYTVKKYNKAITEFYPWIVSDEYCDINTYYDAFRNSNNNSMILLGLPGTGKTTFISNLIARHDYKTMVTSDKELFINDQLFNIFMASDCNLLVIEDADLLILDRRTTDNNIMSKLLNSTEGLVKIENKKIIFTANLSSTDEIDSALMRPGRCFDVMTFRELSRSEAQAVADKMGIDIFAEKDSYTLAEIFNAKNMYKNNRKTGFV